MINYILIGDVFKNLKDNSNVVVIGYGKFGDFFELTDKNNTIIFTDKDVIKWDTEDNFLKEYFFDYHIKQDFDFIDKNGVELRKGDVFSDKDNPSDTNKTWECTITKDLNKDGEIVYNKSEFNTDCIILEKERDKSLGYLKNLKANITELLKFKEYTGVDWK